MRTLVPACSISTSPMPNSATLSINSRISLKFKIGTSGELVAQLLFGARQFKPRSPVVSVRSGHEKNVILGCHGGNESVVLLRHERKLQHVAGIHFCIRQPDR